MAKKVSVIIPSRNEHKNLLWTLQAAMADLEGIDFELIPVLNMCDPAEREALEKYWPFQKGRGKVVVYDEKPSCWQARNAGADAATGRYLLFLDSHVIPKAGSFRGLIDFHDGWKGVAHCALNYWLEPEERALYGYSWQPDKFWGNWTRHKPEFPDYRVPLSGTSSSLIDREVFIEVGGFHPGLGIYGGGETYIDLLVQRFGYSVRMHPRFRLWHLTEKRGYAWNNEDFRHNFMLAAMVLGGEKWLDRVAEHHIKCNKGVEKYDRNTRKMREDVLAEGTPMHEWVNERAKYTLDEVIESWQVP
jgi:glycosyltransferase involved in cell wall biosynthesis